MSGKDKVEDWNESLMVHGWPECGAGAITFEALYQSFKERMLQEAAGPAEVPEIEDKTQGETRVLKGVSPRVDSGALKFGRARTGVFICGEDASWYAAVLDSTLASGLEANQFRRPQLERLLVLLRSCKGDAGWPPRL